MVKVKRYQGMMKTYTVVGGVTIGNPILKIGKIIFEKNENLCDK